MPSFSTHSRAKLNTCDGNLQRLFNEVVKTYDCTIIYGTRGEDIQNKLFDEGKSKVRYPNSKHNSFPSRAVDVVPYPVDWQDTDRFYHFGGYVLATAHRLGIGVRWGGDWDGDLDLKDQNFNDLAHWELI